MSAHPPTLRGLWAILALSLVWMAISCSESDTVSDGIDSGAGTAGAAETGGASAGQAGAGAGGIAASGTAGEAFEAGTSGDAGDTAAGDAQGGEAGAAAGGEAAVEPEGGAAGESAASGGAAGAPSDPDCLSCEQADPDCAERLSACMDADDLAAAGPAEGESKAELCQDVLDCVRQTGCGDNEVDVYQCYCAPDSSVDECTAGAVGGPCQEIVEAAAESTDPVLVSQRWLDPAYASGRAFRLIRCDRRYCVDVCF